MDFLRLSKKYRGEAAETYDKERERTPKWLNEQRAVEDLFSTLPFGLDVLDIPVGTGRFFEVYKRRQCAVTGIDISEHMLGKAEAKARAVELHIRLRQGDIRAIAAPDGAFDVALCVRFLNWVDLGGVRIALTELRRVTNRHVIISASHFVPLSEIRVLSASGLRSLASQTVRRLKTQVMRHRRKNRIIWHEREALLRLFGELGLAISSAICTDPGLKGIASFVYLLEKVPQTAPRSIKI